MEPLKRVRFFNGKLLTADDLSMDQEYQLRKQRIRNLGTLGPGVVSGLNVTAEAAGCRVAPGLAIDRLGREIILPQAELVPFPPALQRAQVMISYKETLVDPLPAPTWEQVEYTRIEEGCSIEIVPAGSLSSEAVLLAEFEQTRHGWRKSSGRTQGLWMIVASLGLGFLLSLRIRRR